MLKKTLSLIISFDETQQAMAAENYCQSHNLPGRLIPIPREINAGCGLAWKANPKEKDMLCKAFDCNNIVWGQAVIIEI